MKQQPSTTEQKKLQDMGFSAEQSAAALQRHKGDLRGAISELVGGGAATVPASAPAPPNAWAKGPPRTRSTSFKRPGSCIGLGGGGAAEPEAAETPNEAARCYNPAETAERLQVRLDHQMATLEMLRGAGASDSELKVLKADVAALEQRIGSLQSEAAAMEEVRAAAALATEVADARLKSEEAARTKRDGLRAKRSHAAALLQTAARAEKEKQAEAQTLAAKKAEEELATKNAALAEAEGLLATEVVERERLEAEAQEAQRLVEDAEVSAAAAVEAGVHSLSQSMATWIEGRYSVETMESSTVTDEGGYAHTVYHLLYTDPTAPAGTAKPVLTKRYSQFEKLRQTLEAELPILAKLEFPEKTWTLYGARWSSTIDDRKTRLEAWLNHVLFLQSPAGQDFCATTVAAFCAAPPAVVAPGGGEKLPVAGTTMLADSTELAG